LHINLIIIEDKKVKRLGTHLEIPVDLRIIAASNQDIEKLINENKFRKDLYYRLNSFIIKIPPLKDHKEDIPLLLDHFMQLFSRKLKKDVNRIDNNVAEKLGDYPFPGNVRELKNMVERAVILCNSQTLNLKHFSFDTQLIYKTGDEIYDLEEAEKELIQKVLKMTR